MCGEVPVEAFSGQNPSGYSWSSQK